MPDRKQWTVMIYLASDNPLAPGIISQLKAIKAAGFHPEANVIVQFDPYVEGVPTHIFDVNIIDKIKNHGAPNIGFAGDDPFVRDLLDDKLWADEKTRDDLKVRDVLKGKFASYNPPLPPNGRQRINGSMHEIDPKRSLEAFLMFCCDKYPADHYVLFVLGHGAVVGNDMFLLDEHSLQKSLTLTDLGDVLRTFTDHVKSENGVFELVGFHSCSVSSIEVAYELQDTARFMLASQGPAFVGSWPYRQILIRLFNDLVSRGHEMTAAEIKEMIVKIAYYCIHNSTDFLLAGYPFDISLTDLSLVSQLTSSIERLVSSLIAGVSKPVCRDLIILSHWRAQSYFGEIYTDLYDFCFCLRREIQSIGGPSDDIQQEMFDACDNLTKALVKERRKSTSETTDPNNTNRIVVCSEFAGPEFQYSHGLSVYFPWSSPSLESEILKNYREYKFSKLDSTWLSFLEAYFEETTRESFRIELLQDEVDDVEKFKEDRLSLVFQQGGSSLSDSSLDDGGKVKSDPRDPTGVGCNCPSIKNYPRDMRPKKDRRFKAGGFLPVSQSVFTTD